MTKREKMIKLLGDDVCSAKCRKCEYRKNEDGCVNHLKESMADHLIANGVIVIPPYGGTAEIIFNPGDVYGTLKLGDDTYQVYLGGIKCHQIESSSNYLSKHVFTIIEL